MTDAEAARAAVSRSGALRGRARAVRGAARAGRGAARSGDRARAARARRRQPATARGARGIRRACHGAHGAGTGVSGAGWPTRFGPRVHSSGIWRAPSQSACLAFSPWGRLVTRTSCPVHRRDRPAAPSRRPTAQSAADPSTVLVRLVVLQPGAQTVQVAGDFNGWNPARTPLERISGGAWTVTLPLKPGRYEYMFVVDGQHWIADPFAAEQNDDGFGSRERGARREA